MKMHHLLQVVGFLGVFAAQITTSSAQSNLPPTVRIDATSPIADETTSHVGVFTISRTGPTNHPAPVFIQYSGTATPGVDYLEQSSMVTIPAGAFSIHIRIQPTPDQVFEGIETVVATIFQCPPSTNFLCATTTPPVDPAHQSATIFIHDGATNHLPVVNVYAPDAYAAEPSSNAVHAATNTATFRIVRSGPTNDWLPVTYTLHGTAQPGVDYENLSPGVVKLSRGVVIPPGHYSVTVTILPLADNEAEALESVILQLEDPPPVGPEPEARPPEYMVGAHRSAGAIIADTDFHVLPQAATCAPLVGCLHISFQASTGNYRIEASTDLVNWETASTVTSVDDTVHFVETAPAAFLRRFYRVVPEPAALGE